MENWLKDLEVEPWDRDYLGIRPDGEPCELDDDIATLQKMAVLVVGNLVDGVLGCRYERQRTADRKTRARFERVRGMRACACVCVRLCQRALIGFDTRGICLDRA